MPTHQENNMTPTPQTMEERFMEDRFLRLFYESEVGSIKSKRYAENISLKDIIDFTNQEIQLALDKREEELRGKIQFLIAHNRLSEKWSDDYYRAFEDLKNFPSI